MNVSKPKVKKENKYKISIKEFLGFMWWSIKFNSSVSSALSIILIVVQVLLQISPIVSSLVYARVFAKLAQIILNKIPYDSAFHELLPFLLIIFAIDLGLSILGIIQNYINTKLRRVRRTMMDKRYASQYASLTSEQLDSPELVNVLRKAEDNFWRLENINQDILQYLTGVVGGLTSVVIVFNFEPLIVLIAFILTVPVVIKDVIYNKIIKDISDSSTEGWREYWTGRWFLTTKSTLIELKVNNLVEKLTKRIFGFRDQYNEKLQEVDNRFTFINTITRLNQVYVVVGIFLIIKKVLLTAGDIGTVTFYTDQINRVNNFFTILIQEAVSLYDEMVYIKDIKTFFELKPSIENGNKKIKIVKPPRIELKDVSFKYPKSQNYALRHVNLVIEPNEEIALVGENGAGKSTLIKLLLRFYLPTEGAILINGIDLKDLDINTYYESIGALFQEYNYPGFFTIKQNIEFAQTKHSNISHINAAQMADIHTSIMKLPKQYETKSYSDFDGGVDLSQGQSQKLVIARAFYRNAPILILDEPTASIDAISEAKIFDRIYKFMEKKTVIIISHRFSTVRKAQKIYVLDKGKIAESGTHSELLKLNGIYHKSFTLQAQGYTKED